MATVYITDGSADVGTPLSGDDLIQLGGSRTIDTGLNQSALAAGLARVEVPLSYSGQYGSTSGALLAQISGQLIYAASKGDMYYTPDGVADTCALIQCIGGGHMHLIGSVGTVTRAEVKSGQFTCAALVTITNYRQTGGLGTLSDDGGTTDPTLVEVGSGHLILRRGATTLTAFFHQGARAPGSVLVDAGTNAIPTLNCDGGIVTIKECGTITTLNCRGSLPDVRNLARKLTITNTNIYMDLPGAQALLDHPLITYSNAATRLMHDGRS